VRTPRTDRPEPSLRQLRHSDRAATLAFTAVAAGVLLGAAALAVDLGMLISARVQSQRAADSGALAGAQRLAISGATASDARDMAKQFANSHDVLTNPVAVDDGDVDVVDDTVRVRVHHSIETLFAQVLGIDRVDVSTVAAAEAVPAGGAACPLPIVVVDNWDDEDGDGLYDEGERYEKCTGDNPSGCTGYDLSDDVGLLLEAKSKNNSTPNDSTPKSCGAEDPSWYCWIDIVNGSGLGATELEDAIRDCESTDLTLSIGDTVTSSSGGKQNVVQEAKTYIDTHDFEHEWSWDDSCVSNGTDCVDGSARIRPLAIVDPETITGTGSGSQAVINNLASVFMDKVASDEDKPHGQDPPPGAWNLYLRFLGSAEGGTGTGGTEGQLLQNVVLIE